MTFKDQVIKKLHSLPVGVEYDLTKEPHAEAFTTVVKSFIRLDFGQPFGWYIEFRDDYKSIKKKKYI